MRWHVVTDCRDGSDGSELLGSRCDQSQAVSDKVDSEASEESQCSVTTTNRKKPY
jgi:hypothetical protein